MEASYKHVMAIALVSISGVAAATVYRVSQALPPVSDTAVHTARAEGQVAYSSPEEAFFEGSHEGPASVSGASSVETAGAAAPAAAEAVQKPPADTITARAYIVGDVQTGKVYIERDSAAVLPVASMSKLVTAFVATNTLEPDATVTITAADAAAPPDKSGIGKGETYTMRELLNPLLISSSNVAAEALAASIDRQKFLELMSSYAWEIGMGSTYFADPSGVSPHNEASARDLFALARYLYSSRPDILALTRTLPDPIASTTEHAAHELPPTHPFIGEPGFLGGKTGRTPEAGDTMMTILSIKGHPIAIVVLGSAYEGRADDTRILAERTGRMLR